MVYTDTKLDDIVNEPLIFDWDEGNINKSIKKHGIRNDEAEQVFINNPLIWEDEIHTTKIEKRYLCLGSTDGGKILFISFTIRGEKLRIISARMANKKERNKV